VLFDNMKTVVLERDAYGPGRHRFHPAFLDYAGHAGFLPRLCRPYRAKTKGKVERFIRYVKGSFWVPFATNMKQAGLMADRHAARASCVRSPMPGSTARRAKYRRRGWFRSVSTCSTFRPPIVAGLYASSPALRRASR
jgi:hypothetical protein